MSHPALPFDPELDALGLVLVVRFGSRATHCERPDSDLDLAVLGADSKRLSHRRLAELTLVLSDRTGLRVDLVDLAVADALIRYEVVRDGSVDHARDRDTWVDLVARTLIDMDDLGPHLRACIEGVKRAATSS